ncbi:uncharacterized protein SCHCODRAFT_02591430 [Schizophyllum commune H4-8]|uniref:uncharacterized protein n=1 Tax=Schizophyllum commune (strain H4-8 / FGSC 9210) TaxID=578458 RepID=UPI00216093A6|nr:uncharacterized protein SCHCODRAFT_02591430 [Schizophyllum commune H4-8]KAI5886331.1 hypothetical protein SCHCODRAFT_02591430 [Schizophyllum commune H4-8]
MDRQPQALTRNGSYKFWSAEQSRPRLPSIAEEDYSPNNQIYRTGFLYRAGVSIWQTMARNLRREGFPYDGPLAYSKGDRPALLLYHRVPRGGRPICVVFLLATFGGAQENDIPSSFHPFLLRARPACARYTNTPLLDTDPVPIHNWVRWDSYVLALPIELDDSDVDTSQLKSWTIGQDKTWVSREWLKHLRELGEKNAEKLAAMCQGDPDFIKRVRDEMIAARGPERRLPEITDTQPSQSFSSAGHPALEACARSYLNAAILQYGLEPTAIKLLPLDVHGILDYLEARKAKGNGSRALVPYKPQHADASQELEEGEIPGLTSDLELRAARILQGEDLDKLFSGLPIEFDDVEVPGLDMAGPQKMIAASPPSAMTTDPSSIACPSTPVKYSFALAEGPITPIEGPYTPVQYTPTTCTPSQALHTPQYLKAPLVKRDMSPEVEERLSERQKLRKLREQALATRKGLRSSRKGQGLPTIMEEDPSMSMTPDRWRPPPPPDRRRRTNATPRTPMKAITNTSTDTTPQMPMEAATKSPMDATPLTPKRGNESACIPWTPETPTPLTRSRSFLDSPIRPTLKRTPSSLKKTSSSSSFKAPSLTSRGQGHYAPYPKLCSRRQVERPE